MENLELRRLRAEIDRLDEELTAVFLRRLGVVGEIAELKEKLGLPVRDETREEAMLARARERGGEAFGAETEALFRALLAISRKRQEKRRGGDT